MIQVTCAQCGLRILVPPTVQGRAGVCFGCGGKLVVPNSERQPHLSDLRFEQGERIGDRYVIEKQIGSGGMGVVYKAHDALIDEEVALKFMNPRMLRTQRGQQLFIKEAQIARRLRHENIVAVHDVATTADGILYLSMEFINGTSLRQYLRKHRSDRKYLDVRLAVELTQQILAALSYAHRHVIHRDLKPENVMLLPGERVKVLDFGLAVATEEAAEEAETEAVGAAGRSPVSPAFGEFGSGPTPLGRGSIGTTAYAAPEQKKHQNVDHRADLYTVGLMLHELLTLRTPIDKPVTIVEARQDVAPSIVAVLDKALFKEKDRRWQTAADFREALREAYDLSYRLVDVQEVVTPSGHTVSTESMVFQEGGSFLMGNNHERAEAPEFEAYVDPFYIDKYPVTVEAYAAFLEETGREEPKFWRDSELNGPRQPITGVTWDDARAYAAWAGKYLPTEKQWEFAARGRENRPYPWGHLEPDTSRCNFNDYLAMPSVVTMHDGGGTPEGVQDMAGNVYEWTLDAYVPYDPKNGGDNTQAQAPRRVVRGGSWHSTASELRTSARKGLFPESQLTTVGFRCVLPAKSLRPAE